MSYKEYKGNIFKEDTLLSNEYIIDKLYELDYCNEEIEKLQRQKEELQVNGLRQETLFKLEIKRLHNIIKEVREYIENNSLYEQDYDYDYEENLYEYPPSDEQARKDILSILDKGE